MFRSNYGRFKLKKNADLNYFCQNPTILLLRTQPFWQCFREDRDPEVAPTGISH